GLAARSGTRIVTELPEPMLGRVDPLRLEQVITHLVDNALKFGAGGEVFIQLVEREGWMILRVIDRGSGIPPDQLGRIFERFERADAGGHYAGLGLGLFITRTVVVASGGHIHADSQLGEGSCFTVELPLG